MFSILLTSRYRKLGYVKLTTMTISGKICSNLFPVGILVIMSLLGLWLDRIFFDLQSELDNLKKKDTIYIEYYRD